VAQYSIENREFGPIPIKYGGNELFTTLSSQNVPELSGSSSSEIFWMAAFSTPIGEPSRPVVQGNNVLVLYPTEAGVADESSVENIISMYNNFWLNYVTEQSLHQHFLNSPKMDDKFIEVYFRNQMGSW
jgi:hypothetical protein